MSTIYFVATHIACAAFFDHSLGRSGSVLLSKGTVLDPGRHMPGDETFPRSLAWILQFSDVVKLVRLSFLIACHSAAKVQVRFSKLKSRGTLQIIT